MLRFSYAKYFILLGGIIILFSCNENDKRSIENSAAAFDIKQAEASITQSNLNFMKSYKSGDSVSVANCYTTDAKIMAANLPVITGREKIKQFIGQTMRSGAKNFELSTIKIWGDSIIVAEEGTYKISDSEEALVDKGEYIVLWKLEAGNWKMFRDIWTSDLPVSNLSTKKGEIR